MKVMISQPMRGRKEEDIKKERESIVQRFNEMHIEVIDNLFTEEAPKDCNQGVYYLGKSISAMSDIDALYMCDSWEMYKGCSIERDVAISYGIKVLYSDFFQNDNGILTRRDI